MSTVCFSMPGSCTESWRSGCRPAQSVMQGLKWHNWPTRYLACELCYPTTLAYSTSKHTLPLQALCVHFLIFFFLSACLFLLYKQVHVVYWLSCWNETEFELFFQSKCKNTANWKLSSWSKGKEAAVMHFLFYFFFVSLAKKIYKDPRGRGTVKFPM